MVFQMECLEQENTVTLWWMKKIVAGMKHHLAYRIVWHQGKFEDQAHVCLKWLLWPNMYSAEQRKSGPYWPTSRIGVSQWYASSDILRS